ncbi:hypothetical protein BSKO_02157 [Bryopsis sp. KO-2023]|nr:hypothetical protein BSKO_02157 [Bryopsis sp. KO-2023]
MGRGKEEVSCFRGENGSDIQNPGRHPLTWWSAHRKKQLNKSRKESFGGPRDSDAKNKRNAPPNFATIAQGFEGAFGNVASCVSAVLLGKPSFVEPLDVFTKRGGRKLQYAWDGKRIRAISCDDINNPQSSRRLVTNASMVGSHLRAAFLPNASSVSNDYWEFIKWRNCQRFWGTSLKLLGTQSLLMALGIGAKKSLTASAAINWMLRDGLGRVVRMVVAAKYGQSFDSDLKRARLKATVLFTATTAFEIIAPSFPKYFLLLASISNVGQAVTLTTYVSTSPALASNFSRKGNIADLTAKSQAQHMLVDSIALGIVASLTHVFRHTPRVFPLAAYPVCAAMSVLCVRRELRSIELRTLNSERLGVLAEQWVGGEKIMVPKEMSKIEKLWGEPLSQWSGVRMEIGPLENVVSTPVEMEELLLRHQGDNYVVGFRDGEKPTAVVSLSQKAELEDMATVLLHVARLNQMLASYSNKNEGLRDSHVFAKKNYKKFIRALNEHGWVTNPFPFSSTERQGYLLD